MEGLKMASPGSDLDDQEVLPPDLDIFGQKICPHTMTNVLRRVANAIRTRSRFDIGVVNAAKIVNMRRDRELHDAVASSDAVYADGMSVVWASRFLGKPLPERIAGIDLMHAIMKQGDSAGYRVFCLGASPEVLDATCTAFEENYPGVTICGRHHGYFDASSEESVANKVRESNADVLFVAITSPKKERFMARWAEMMGVPVVHGVGGSFDVVAGLVERAPEGWQKLGLEWLFRVKQEPRRLWKRYLVTNALFLKLVVTEKFRLLFRS